MRFHGVKTIPQSPVTPDTILSFKLTAATVQTYDFPTNAHMFRISFGSTIASACFVNFGGVASVPTTAYVQSTQSSSQFNIPLGMGESRIYQRHSGTTSFSVISVSSGFFCIEYWNRGG